MRVWQAEVFSLCEDKDHDQLFSGGKSELINCDCGYALDMKFSHWKEMNMIEVAKLLLDQDQLVTPIILDSDFENDLDEFLERELATK